MAQVLGLVSVVVLGIPVAKVFGLVSVVLRIPVAQVLPVAE